MPLRTFETVFSDSPSVNLRVGWDRSRFLQLGRALWHFERKFLDVSISYRNLDQEQDYDLGVVSAANSDQRLLEQWADLYESHSPGDWVLLGTKLYTLALDRGAA